MNSRPRSRSSMPSSKAGSGPRISMGSKTPTLSTTSTFSTIRGLAKPEDRRPSEMVTLARMRHAWLALLAIGGGHAPSKGAPPPPVGVEPAFDPPQPALRLPRHFLPTRYIARVAIDPAQPMFDG